MSYALFFLLSTASTLPFMLVTLIVSLSGGMGAQKIQKNRRLNLARCCWYNSKAQTKVDHDIVCVDHMDYMLKSCMKVTKIHQRKFFKENSYCTSGNSNMKG
jgi:hypothetical protein